MDLELNKRLRLICHKTPTYPTQNIFPEQRSELLKFITVILRRQQVINPITYMIENNDLNLLGVDWTDRIALWKLFLIFDFQLKWFKHLEWHDPIMQNILFIQARITLFEIMQLFYCLRNSNIYIYIYIWRTKTRKV